MEKGLDKFDREYPMLAGRQIPAGVWNSYLIRTPKR